MPPRRGSRRRRRPGRDFHGRRRAPMRIFLSTGEPSGDLHAANLIRALRKRLPDAEFVGYGGPHMARAGARVLFPLTELAVMWFLRVLLNIHKFIGLLNRASEEFRDHRPDALVLIDYPGFNWAMARRAKERGIPVIYYVPPQLWAWAGWRVKKMRKYVDLVLCSLPFEERWYKDRGVAAATFVGHPYFDELADRELDGEFVASMRADGSEIVAILPGSRTQEIIRNLPMMLRAAVAVHRARPDARFEVACLHEKHQRMVRNMIEELGVGDLPITVHAGRTAELIRVATLAWSVSGSVSLELLTEALPTVIVYRVRPIDLWIARPFIKAKYITLVNLLADRELMPEYLTSKDVDEELAGWATHWLDEPVERAAASEALAELRDRVARPGASERAAARIAALVDPRTTNLRGPHVAPDRVRERDA